MYYVYVLRCIDGSLYTGITNDIPKRMEAHLKGVGAKYTKSHYPQKIELLLSCKDKKTACKIEFHFKRLKKEKKERIIRGEDLQKYLELEIEYEKVSFIDWNDSIFRHL